MSAAFARKPGRPSRRESCPGWCLDAHGADQGAGRLCSVCGEPVKQGEMELEVEYRRDGRTSDLDHYFLHVRCFAAWECESRNHLAHRTTSSTRLAGAPSEADRSDLTGTSDGGMILGGGCGVSNP
jgi:hypothetical protein